MAALKLLEAPSGPVLADFPEDAPQSEDFAEGWACPINLSDEKRELTDSEALLMAFKSEINRMRSWYDLGVTRHGRTTFGVSGLDPGTIGAFVGGFLEGKIPDNPRADLSLALVLKLAVDDIKAYYLEAAAAEPGKSEPTSVELADWFWKETVAARVLRAVKEACQNGTDPMLKITGQRLIVPMSYL